MSELIELQGAVRADGKPFVIVLEDGEQTGQLTPGEAVNFGTRAIQAAIEAERDAALVIAMKKQGLSTEEVGGLLTMIREHRSQVDPDPRQDHRPGDLDRPEGGGE
jgi:anthranilate phosphoribosyltransferase